MTPKPDPKALIPHSDDWAAWIEHPVTRFVATAWANAADAQRDVWIALSWGSGNPDPEKLLEYRTRADAYMAFLETPLEDYVRLVQKA
jgi:hypothetical protein